MVNPVEGALSHFLLKHMEAYPVLCVEIIISVQDVGGLLVNLLAATEEVAACADNIA